METELKSRLEQLENEVKFLREKIQTIEKPPDEQMVIAVVSGDLDKILAAMILALAATAYDIKVKLFFSFWSLAALRDPKKSVKKTGLISKLFGLMLPKGTNKLKLSHFNMLGAGRGMINSLMKKNGVLSLEQMFKEAGELEIEITICEMSMNLMGLQLEEMIDYPHLKIAGAATFISEANESNIQFFI